MIRRLRRDIKATAALEFALIAPAMLTLFYGTISMGFAFWTLCTLQMVAQQSARCSAISSTSCATVTTGCDSASPVVCYVESVATQMSVTPITANEVAISTTSSGGLLFTTVTITYAYILVGYSMTLYVSSSYPQNVSSWITMPAAS
jgi:Flp pilus assembly protein TadG